MYIALYILPCESCLLTCLLIGFYCGLKPPDLVNLFETQNAPSPDDLPAPPTDVPADKSADIPPNPTREAPGPPPNKTAGITNVMSSLISAL